LGVKVSHGHKSQHVNGADAVVVSTAVQADNPEVVAARESRIPVVPRALMLAELMRLKQGVAIAGTHGKTTTTSLVASVLAEAGLDPTFVIGGRLNAAGSNARLGAGDFIVVEADESDASFLHLTPTIAVVTNVDQDHMETYGHDVKRLERAFVDFLQRLPFWGVAVLCIDDDTVRSLVPSVAKSIVTYGLAADARLRAFSVTHAGGRMRFVATSAGHADHAVELALPGVHNVRNALAAIAVGLALAVPIATIAKALAGFGGVHRRFERLGVYRGADVVDDYAHHPTEVAATLAAARQVFPRKVIHAVFQPHLFSRTRDLAVDFGRALAAADHVIVTDVYPSREAPIPGVSGELVARAVEAVGHARVDYCAGWREARERLGALGEGDVVFTLGAGDVYRLAQALAGEEAA
jgi:UDP-N-acetylmuramate--alanine ligase